MGILSPETFTGGNTSWLVIIYSGNVRLTSHLKIKQHHLSYWQTKKKQNNIIHTKSPPTYRKGIIKPNTHSLRNLRARYWWIGRWRHLQRDLEATIQKSKGWMPLLHSPESQQCPPSSHVCGVRLSTRQEEKNLPIEKMTIKKIPRILCFKATNPNLETLLNVKSMPKSNQSPVY